MRVRTLWRWLPCLTVASCGKGPDDQAIVRRWLTCIECSDGELDSIKAVARRDRDGLRVLLQDRLLAGPSAALADSLRRRFAASYNLLHTAPVPQDREAYKHEYLLRFVSTWRVRAAVALAGVGNAQAALDSAAKGMFRDPADSLLSPGAKRFLVLARDSLSQFPWQGSATAQGARSTAGPRVVAPRSSASTRTPAPP